MSSYRERELPDERLLPDDWLPLPDDDEGAGAELRDGAGDDAGGEYDGAGRDAGSERVDDRSELPEERDDEELPDDEEPDDRPKSSGRDNERAGVDDRRSVDVRVRLVLGA